MVPDEFAMTQTRCTMTPPQATATNPLELAHAVAALQTETSVADLLASVPQSLQEEAPKTVAVRDSYQHQTPGSGSIEGKAEETSVRSATPELSHSSTEPEDLDTRLARSRERNREHARRTRLRKKAQLEALQSKVKGLEAERQVLKQNLEECGIASILLGLSAGGQDAAPSVALDTASTNGASRMVQLISTGKRKRFLSESMAEQHAIQAQSLSIHIDGEVTTIGGGKSHINWKTGVYRDEHGNQKQLSVEQLENLRRERNRMHAKMTRDRKKCFIATIEKTIEDLQNENKRLKDMLTKLSAAKYSQLVTPMSSPELSSVPHPHPPAELGRDPKRANHGFTLDS